ncbi:MAG: hypothetical protein RMK00_02845 [Bacteroidota bacterium]|nr:hypothetical protein [Candidatus Kapabacteria bacterium]MDW8074697.1 hypothetical protein [Bacteroidota bacterium]
MQDKGATFASFLRASGISLIGQIVYYAIYFSAIRVILSTLPKEENGLLTLVQQWTTAALAIALMTGYTTYIVQRLRTEINPGVFFSTIFWLRTGISIVVVVGLTILLALTRNIPPSVTIIGALASLGMARALTLRTTLELPFQSQMRFGILTLLSTIDVVLIVVLLLAQRPALSAVNVFTAQALATFPSIAALCIMAWRSGFLRAKIHIPTLRSILHEAPTLSVLTALLYLHMLTDITMLEVLGTRAMVGVYGASAYAALPLNILGSIFWSPLAPVLSQKLQHDTIHAPITFDRYLRLIGVSIGIVGATVSSLMPFVIELLTAGVYADHTAEFLLQLWVGALSAILVAVQMYGSLLALYRETVITIGMLLAGSLLFDWWLIKMGGTSGLLIAKALSNALALGCAAVFFRRASYRTLGMRIVQLSAWILMTGITTAALYALSNDVIIRLLIGVGSALILAIVMKLIRMSDVRVLAAELKRQRSSA